MGPTLSKIRHPIPRKGSDNGKGSGFITSESSGSLTPLRATAHGVEGYCTD